ncbi:MAG: hypothetical protein AAB464_02055 [Patescibacteria group bacterium]
MAIEQNYLPDKEPDNFDAVWKIIKDNPLDPHLKFDINKLSNDDFELAEKFKNDILTEKEISGYIENLEKKGIEPGNLHYDFAASLKNKIIIKELEQKRTEKKKGGFA